MTDRASAGAAATSVVIGTLPGLDAGTAPLVIDEASGQLMDVLASSGCQPQAWLRHAGGASDPAPWPRGGPFTSAFVRMAKSKEALEMALHAAAAIIPPGAPIVVFGANDEGIKGVVRPLAIVAEAVQTIDVRRHCRVVMGRRRAAIAELRGRLADWRQAGEISIGGTTRAWVSYPGVFAGGRLDEGTALLAGHLPALAAGGRVLDFGCGGGVIAACALAQQPGAIVDMLDADAVAIEAARENVPEARALIADRFAAVAGIRYQAILSNPPIHNGVREDHGVLGELIAQAPKFLRQGGALQIVVQRRIKAAEPMRAAFGNVTVVAETGKFWVLRSDLAVKRQ